MAIEYNIPQTSKRVDFLISGYGWNGKGNVVIVELKQWEKLASIDGQDAIVETYTGGANRRVVHPCYQAWSYAALIRDMFKTTKSVFIPVRIFIIIQEAKMIHWIKNNIRILWKKHLHLLTGKENLFVHLSKSKL